MLTYGCLDLPSQTEHISRRAPALLDDAALRTLLLGAVLLDTSNLTGASVRPFAAWRSAYAARSPRLPQEGT
jgi:hypothetical protein